jgi:DNA polymerase III subunit gamma/tau
VRIASLGDLDNLTDLVAELRNGTPPSPSGSPGPAVPAPAFAAKKKDDLMAEVRPLGGRSTGADNLQPKGGTPTANARQLWDQAVSLVENMTADHARAASGIAIRAPDQLAVVFSAKYNFSKAFCERPDRAAKLEEAVESVAGQRFRLVFELAEEPAGSETAATRVISPRQRKAEVEAEIRRRPLVEKAAKLFSASVDVLEKA